MKAAILESAGQSLKIYHDVQINGPRDGEVLVQVKNCGVCHSDLNVVNGSFPVFGTVILGHEASGIVEKVGAGVTQLQAGDHVVLTIAPPCGHCYFCLREDYSLCQKNTGMNQFSLPDGSIALSRHGEKIYHGFGMAAFAEKVVLPARAAIRIDKDIPFELACLAGCALQTGVGAVLNTAKVEQGATVLIMGLGGVGISAVQGAKIAGASIILVSDPVAERREMALKLGATHAVNPLEATLHGNIVEKTCRKLTNKIGMDYAFETAGIAKLIETGINCIRPGGLTIAVGAPPLDQGISINPVTLFGSMEKKLCGCMLGSCNSLTDIPRLLQFWREGKLNLQDMVTSLRPLEEINEAFADMKAGRGIRTVLKI
jgi:Zn-dependent alcohol dehydrogenase